MEHDKNIVHGAEPAPAIPNTSFGQLLYDKLSKSRIKTPLLIDAFTKEEITAQQLLEKSCNLSEALRVTGYASNAVIAIISENSLQFFYPVFASLFNKTIACLINPASTPLELRHYFKITKPKLIFCSKKSSNRIVELQKEMSCIDRVIVLDSNTSTPGTIGLNEFIENTLHGNFVESSRFQPMTAFDPVKTPALIMFSSGTTGLPKGVTLSHNNFVVAQSIAAKGISWTNKVDPYSPETYFGFAPFYHTMGINRAFHNMLYDKRLLVMDHFDEDVFLKSIQDYRIVMVPVPPPLMVLLAKSPKVEQYDLSSLKFIGTGAAPVSKQIQDQVVSRFNLTSTPQGYGLTESTFALIVLPPGINKPDSCGFLPPLTSCKVRDLETEEALGPNQAGELCFKGPQIMMGYYKDDISTKAAFTNDGWFKTGDVGYYDEEGYFYIVDRLKELIKYKGYQVAPAELESILLGHPKIKDAAVVGRSDETCGELPTAFLVKQDDVQVTEKEIKDFVSGLVSPQKRLRGGVLCVSTIPKTSSGKIQRKELRKLLENKTKYKSKL